VTVSVASLGGCDLGGSTDGSIPGARSTVGSPDAMPSATNASTESVPLGKMVNCPDPNFGAGVAIPSSLWGFLEACTNDYGNILLKNVSALQLRVQPTNYTSLGAPVRASNEFRDTVNAQLATDGSQLAADGKSYAVALVPPGGYVVAYGAPATVNVGIFRPDAYQAYVSDVLARYIQSKATPKSQSIATSAATCAEEASDLWLQEQDPNLDLDQLLAEAALGPARMCNKLVNEVCRTADLEIGWGT
jgi:hypothetical protein